ncbi:DNA-binding domain-containing protein [Paracidovorax anthurii]|uniref:Putative DNA-binding protein n=1 Tax=Paracidovorax anthurii TaxID=78229 RepID=A0A328ZT60_9BURK|nr:DNA-binding domain-containing protein [Paracidovorax anthurii]RAR85466.1 putative DNA-binding protein [Paracidovorax anthurii]
MTPAPETLADVQQWMLDALVHPGSAPPRAASALLEPGAHLGAAACLAIYQRSYLLRLVHCLQEQFPATRHALGPDVFHAFATEYLQAHPSRSHTLYELGRHFPQWLEDTRPDHDLPPAQRETWIDFMVDLARYERVLYHLFDAPGHEGRPWPGEATPDGELVLQPCAVLVTGRYPVAWYYHEVRAGRDPQPPQARPFHALIVRRDYLTHTYPVSPLHHRFLAEVQARGGIPQALQAIADGTGHPLDAVAHSWRTEVRQPWLQAGFFVAQEPVASGA